MANKKKKTKSISKTSDREAEILAAERELQVNSLIRSVREKMRANKH